MNATPTLPYPSSLAVPPPVAGPVQGMTPEQVAIVKATTPVLQLHGEAIARAFYLLLLGENPGLRPMFDGGRQASGEQPRALAAAILAYAANVDAIERITPGLDRIVARHCRVDVRPEHYPIVGEALLRAIANVLGDAAHPEIIDAWSAAYDRLAKNLIAMERKSQAFY